MEAKLVPNNVQGYLVFPSDHDKTLSSSIWIKSGKQNIKLPKELFNRKSTPSSNGKTLNFRFPVVTVPIFYFITYMTVKKNPSMRLAETIFNMVRSD